MDTGIRNSSGLSSSHGRYALKQRPEQELTGTALHPRLSSEGHRDTGQTLRYKKLALLLSGGTDRLTRCPISNGTGNDSYCPVSNGTQGQPSDTLKFAQ